MVTRVVKLGRNLAVVIPRKLAEENGLRAGASLDLRVEGSGLVASTAAHRYTIEELLAGVTPENRHPETDWGPPVGRERI